MTDEPKFDFKRSVIPYSDGRGHRASARVWDTVEGPRLQIEMTYQIAVNDWPALRKAVDEIIALAAAVIEQNGENVERAK